MSNTEINEIEELANQEYKYGFVTEIDSDTFKPGLNEDVIRALSEKKEEPEWMLEWRLKAYRQWLKMVEPQWPNVNYPPVDFQEISYYSAPKQKKKLNSLDEVDPEILSAFKSWVSPSKSRNCSLMSRLMPCSTQYRLQPPTKKN